jgi:hypothetical protein
VLGCCVEQVQSDTAITFMYHLDGPLMAQLACCSWRLMCIFDRTLSKRWWRVHTTTVLRDVGESAESKNYAGGGSYRYIF